MPEDATQIAVEAVDAPEAVEIDVEPSEKAASAAESKDDANEGVERTRSALKGLWTKSAAKADAEADESVDQDEDATTDDDESEPSPKPKGKVEEDGESRREAVLIVKSRLSRLGIASEKALKALEGESTDDLTTYAKNLGDRLASQDRLGNEKRDLEAKIKTMSAELEAAKAAKPAEMPPKLAALKAHLAATYDETTANLMVEAMMEKESKTPALAPSAPDKVVETKVDKALSREDVVENLRPDLDRLADTIPQLKKHAERVALVDVADRLFRAGVFEGENPTPLSILKVAAWKRYGGDDPDTAQRRFVATSREQLDGQLRAPSAPKTAAPRPMSERERMQWAGRQLMKGKSPTRVNAELNKMTRT